MWFADVMRISFRQNDFHFRHRDHRQEAHEEQEEREEDAERADERPDIDPGRDKIIPRKTEGSRGASAPTMMMKRSNHMPAFTHMQTM